MHDWTQDWPDDARYLDEWTLGATSFGAERRPATKHAAKTHDEAVRDLQHNLERHKRHPHSSRDAAKLAAIIAHTSGANPATIAAIANALPNSGNVADAIAFAAPSLMPGFQSAAGQMGMYVPPPLGIRPAPPSGWGWPFGRRPAPPAPPWQSQQQQPWQPQPPAPPMQPPPPSYAGGGGGGAAPSGGSGGDGSDSSSDASAAPADGSTDGSSDGTTNPQTDPQTDPNAGQAQPANGSTTVSGDSMGCDLLDDDDFAYFHPRG